MAYCICPGWLWWWRIWWNEDWQGKPKFLEKTCPSATLSTTNPTWPDPGANPGRRGGKPATNRLSYDAARLSVCWLLLRCLPYLRPWRLKQHVPPKVYGLLPQCKAYIPEDVNLNCYCVGLEIRGGARNDPVLDPLMKYLFQLQYKKLTYKKKTIACRFILCESTVQYDHRYVW
jgi:hypothetical protein